MDALRRLCCCAGEDDEESDLRYERLPENSNVTVVRGRQDGYTNGGSDFTDRGNSTAKDAAEQQVQDQYSRILESTQHSIIDLSHPEGGRLATSDYITRARRYGDCIIAHDLRVAKNSSPASKIISGGMLSDSGNRVADYLGRPCIPPATLQSIKEFTEKAQTAVETIQISYKDDLVVHMDF